MKKLLLTFLLCSVFAVSIIAGGNYFKIHNDGRYKVFVNVKCVDGSYYECAGIPPVLKPWKEFECEAREIELFMNMENGRCANSQGILRNTGYKDVVLRDGKMSVK